MRQQIGQKGYDKMQINSSRGSLVRSRNLRSAKRSRMGKVLRCRTSLSNSSKTNSTNRTQFGSVSSSQAKQIAMYEKIEKCTTDIQKNVKDLITIGKMSYTEDETGKEAKENDEAKLLSGIKDFISDYNLVHSALNDLGSITDLALKKSLDTTVSENSVALKELGITVSKSGELILDEVTFKKADMEKIKELFAKEDSFADKISSKMESIGKSASNSLTMLDKLYGATSTYNKYGMNNPYYNTGYDNYINGSNFTGNGYYNGKYYNNTNWYM